MNNSQPLSPVTHKPNNNNNNNNATRMRNNVRKANQNGELRLDFNEKFNGRNFDFNEKFNGLNSILMRNLMVGTAFNEKFNGRSEFR